MNQALRGADRLQLDMRYAQWDALRQSLGYLLRPHRASLVHSSCLYLPRRILRGHEAVIRAARQNPDRLYAMTPRKFEQFIALLFQELGFEVSLTPQTHDGGFDLLAENKVLGIPFQWLVECKRYAPGRNVSVQIVRSLLGVLSDQRASLALLITTSGFTRAARSLASRNSSFLHLWSLRDLMEQLQASPV
jgi:restriction system protein